MKAKAMNLWGVDPEDGQPILFTHDHIVAQALGGLDQLSNTQTMCCWHNWRKGSKEGLIVLERQRQMKIENGPVTFTYVGIKKEPRIINRAVVCRRTFNFYLNDPGTWDTNKFLDIIWKNAGLCCVEVRLVNNTYRHPVLQKLAHRYDLFFITGPGLIDPQKVNAMMRNIEADVRNELDVYMADTHFVIDDENIPHIPPKVKAYFAVNPAAGGMGRLLVLGGFSRIQVSLRA